MRKIFLLEKGEGGNPIRGKSGDAGRCRLRAALKAKYGGEEKLEMKKSGQKGS